MQIEFDPEKRARTPDERELNLARAGKVFAACHFTIEDLRFDYGECRFVTFGTLAGRMVVMVWTPRGSARRVIAVRKANAGEQERYGSRLAGP